MKPLKPKTKGKYDELINQIRTELNVPMNRTTLQRMALEFYIKRLTSQNGKVDIKAIAGNLAKVRLENELSNAEKKVAEKKKAIEALK